MRTTTSIIASAMALCLPGTIAAAAQEPPTQGMTVTRDADTGTLRAPTASELQALQGQPQARTVQPAQPALEVRSDGRRRAYLGESRLVYSVVTRGPDGKIDQRCVNGAHAAERIVNQAAPAAATEESHHGHR